MVSISTDTSGNRKIQFSDGNGQRKIVRIGKPSMKAAEKILAKIEAILEAKLSCRSLAPEVATWVGEIPDVLAKRLVAVGLIAPREKRQEDATLLGEFIDAYVESRTDIKLRTRINLLQVRRHLVAYFGETKPLRDVNPGDSDEWRRWMLTKLGENTVRRHCGRAKQLFRAALRKRLIAENPFADMKGCSAQANKSREHFVSRDVAAQVIAACPDNEWRLIFALARFGGLRTPSETLLLRWADVDWERGRMLIRSPKTEHHEGKDSRLVPIFPELRPHLEAAWDQAADGTEFVVTRYRDCNSNLRTQLLRIIAKAGLTSWPKLFQNLRSTRETELAETFPLHVVTAWLGNSQLIAAKHYLQVTDEHFAKATHNQTHSAAEMSEPDGIVRPAITPDIKKASHFRGVPFGAVECTLNQYPREDSNLQPSAPEADALSN